MLYIHEYTPYSCYTYVTLHVYSIVIQKCSVYSIHAPCVYNMRTRVYCACITKEFMCYTVMYNFDFPQCQFVQHQGKEHRTKGVTPDVHLMETKSCLEGETKIIIFSLIIISSYMYKYTYTPLEKRVSIKVKLHPQS